MTKSKKVVYMAKLKGIIFIDVPFLFTSQIWMFKQLLFCKSSLTEIMIQ